MVCQDISDTTVASASKLLQPPNNEQAWTILPACSCVCAAATHSRTRSLSVCLAKL